MFDLLSHWLTNPQESAAAESFPTINDIRERLIVLPHLIEWNLATLSSSQRKTESRRSFILLSIQHLQEWAQPVREKRVSGLQSKQRTLETLHLEDSAPNAMYGWARERERERERERGGSSSVHKMKLALLIESEPDDRVGYLQTLTLGFYCEREQEMQRMKNGCSLDRYASAGCS